MQSLVCSSESPSYMTYRARLEGTSETDSNTIISILDKWVKSGPDLIVLGELMTADSECKLVISSLNEEECMKYTTTSSPSQSSSMPFEIIGGVIAAVIVIVVVVIIAVTVVVVRVRHKHRNTTTFLNTQIITDQ